MADQQLHDSTAASPATARTTRRRWLPLVFGRLLAALLALALALLLADRALLGWVRWTSDWLSTHAKGLREPATQLEPLATHGPRDAAMVLVAAWDPLQPAQTAALRCLATYADARNAGPQDGGRPAVRLVRLLAPQTPAALADAIGALEQQELMWPWLLGDTPPDQPLSVAAVLAHVRQQGEREATVVQRALDDSDAQIQARRELRLATGLGLRGGDVLVNGVPRPMAELCPAAGQWQALGRAEDALAAVRTKHMGVAEAHARLQTAAQVEPAVRDRYRQWILEGRKASMATASP